MLPPATNPQWNPNASIEERRQFRSKLHYQLATLVRKHWRHEVELDKADRLLFMALLRRDWRKAFSPITRPGRLKRGCTPYQAAVRALATVHFSHRDARWIELSEGLITPELLADLRKRLPKPIEEMHHKLPDAPYVEVDHA